MRSGPEIDADQSRELTVALIAEEVSALTAEWPAGDPLDDGTAALIALAVRCCGTTLDIDGTRSSLIEALDAGATGEQVAEMMVLISGIGIHGLIGTSSVVAEVLRDRGHPAMHPEFSVEQAAVWESVGGGDARESRIAAVAPEFLPNLVRLVPREMLQALLDFRAAPWLSSTMSPLQMELIGIAVDTMPSHRFLPTLRMHVTRAGELGAGRTAVQDVLNIAAAAPPHRGVW